MTAQDALSLVIGALELTLALVVLRHLGRFGRTMPWLAVLMAFFAFRGVDRVYVAIRGDEPTAVALASDSVLVLVLVLLLFGIERTVRGLRLAQDEASYREAEYERALSHYRTLARHRLANPITAIRGGVATLKTMPEVDRETQLQLLETIDREAARLETVALDPDPASTEERGLRPRPDV